MKKVKIMLTAIAIFAVVGGALAFKASKFNTNLYCTDNANDRCSVLREQVSTTGQPGDFLENTYCTFTANSNAKCGKIDIYVNP